MSAVLTGPPAAEPVSLPEIKAYLRIESSHEDTFIAGLVTAARQHAESTTGLVMITQSWSVHLDCWSESGLIELPISPVQSVDSLTVHGADGASELVDPAHYVSDLTSRPARLALRSGHVGAVPGRLLAGLEIALTCGFGPSGSDVPEPLRQAMLRLAAHWYDTRKLDEADARKTAIPFGISCLLAPYRDIRL